MNYAEDMVYLRTYHICTCLCITMKYPSVIVSFILKRAMFLFWNSWYFDFKKERGLWYTPEPKIFCIILWVEIIWYVCVFWSTEPDGMYELWGGEDWNTSAPTWVLTSDRGHTGPRIWVTNTHYLRPTIQSSMPMKRDKWYKYNRQRVKYRHTGHQFNLPKWLSVDSLVTGGT